MNKFCKYIWKLLFICAILGVFLWSFNRKVVDHMICYNGLYYEWIYEDGMNELQEKYLEQNGIALRITDDMLGDVLDIPTSLGDCNIYSIHNANTMDVLIMEHNGQYMFLLSERVPGSQTFVQP